MYNLDLFDDAPAIEAAGDTALIVEDSAENADIAANPELQHIETAGGAASIVEDSTENVDIAANPEPQPPETEKSASPFSNEAMQWAIDEIESIADAGNSKTRLKAIKASDDQYRGLLDACLLVAWRKRVAYETARKGDSVQGETSAAGWVQRDPELAAACGSLIRAAIPVNELAMLPPAFMPDQA